MATSSRKSGFPGMFDGQSTENMRRQFIEAPLDAAVPATLGPVSELAKVLTSLPAAFVASQKKELQRVRETSGDYDERIPALEASIEQSEILQVMAGRGQSRVQRLIGSLATGENVFHGFVSDPDFAPMSGVTVRLTGTKRGRGKAAATTDEDGYFSIALGPNDYGTQDSSKRSLSISQRVNKLFETRKLDSTVTPEAEKDEEASQSTVQILRKNTLLHEDPLPVTVDEGTIYREYVIGEKESSEDDFNEFVWGKSAEVEQDQTATDTVKKKSPKK